MQKSNFKLSADIQFISRFDVPTKWWQFSKTHQMEFPEIAEADLAGYGSVTDESNSIHHIRLSLDYLQSAKGRLFLSAYYEALRNLKPEQRPTYFGKPNDFLSYSVNLEIENKAAHAMPVVLDAYEVLTTTEKLMFTARQLKQLTAKTIILNSENDTTNSEGNEKNMALYFAEFWSANADLMEMHYYDYDAETDEDAEKLHKTTLDSRLFTQQFNRIAHNINDIFNSANSALKNPLNTSV